MSDEDDPKRHVLKAQSGEYRITGGDADLAVTRGDFGAALNNLTRANLALIEILVDLSRGGLIRPDLLESALEATKALNGQLTQILPTKEGG